MYRCSVEVVMGSDECITTGAEERVKKPCRQVFQVFKRLSVLCIAAIMPRPPEVVRLQLPRRFDGFMDGTRYGIASQL